MTVVSLVAVLRDSVGTSHMYIVTVLRDRCVLVERSVLTVINEDITSDYWLKIGDFVPTGAS